MRRMLIKAILFEYGIAWVFFRSLYAIKLWLLKRVGWFEKLFEKSVSIKRVDMIDVPLDKIQELYATLPSESKKSCISKADAAIQGKIYAFSSRPLDYGHPIDWHYNPLTGSTIYKNRKWYDIPDFDAQAGDIKVFWEPSRFNHFVLFARAYLMSEDAKYYEAFSQQLAAWLEHNPYSYGVNYKCGQEASIRMFNGLMAYRIFSSKGLTDDHDEKNIKQLIEGSYKKVLSNFFYAHRCIRNNHTLSELTGMMVGAWCANDAKQLKKANRLFQKEINRQFLADGGYIQNSFNYQRLALHLIAFNLMIQEKTGFELKGRNLIKVSKSMALLSNMMTSNGHVPNYGANDGAYLLPLHSADYLDYRPLLNTMYALLEKKMPFKNHRIQEEAVWFSGRTFEDSSQYELYNERIFHPQAGLYGMDLQDGLVMMVMRNGRSRSGHMDQMHIDLWHRGRNLFCDAGTYSYASKDFPLGKTRYHNVVSVDAKDQHKKFIRFMAYGRPKVKDVYTDSNTISGMSCFSPGYEHRRQLIRQGDSLRLQDVITSKHHGYAEIIFNTPYDVEKTFQGFYLKDDGVYLLKAQADQDFLLEDGYRSLYYLSKETINRIIFKVPIKNRQTHFNIDFKLY